MKRNVHVGVMVSWEHTYLHVQLYFRMLITDVTYNYWFPRGVLRFLNIILNLNTLILQVDLWTVEKIMADTKRLSVQPCIR